MLQANDYPISVQFDFASGKFDPVEIRDDRNLSDLQMMFQDKTVVAEILADADPLIYEIWYHPFETSKSDMALGVTRLLPGKIGDEYHMTKGHIHERDDQPEIYFCVQGEGYLLLQTIDGEFPRRTLERRHHLAYSADVGAPRRQYRKRNAGLCSLLPFERRPRLRPHYRKGFRQLLLEREGRPTLVDSPRWT